jgi:hypothetical protein
MRRIISGRAYNTETAALIAIATPKGPGSDEEHQLYRSRYGEFFFVYNYLTPGDVMQAEVVPTTYDQALAFAEKHANDAVERWFGNVPEAGQEERQLTLRVPGPLAATAQHIADGLKISLNTYLMRCVERGVASDSKELEKGRT